MMLFFGSSPFSVLNRAVGMIPMVGRTVFHSASARAVSSRFGIASMAGLRSGQSAALVTKCSMTSVPSAVLRPS